MVPNERDGTLQIQFRMPTANHKTFFYSEKTVHPVILSDFSIEVVPRTHNSYGTGSNPVGRTMHK